MRKLIASIAMAVMFAVLSVVSAAGDRARPRPAGWEWGQTTQNGSYTQVIAGWEWKRQPAAGWDWARPAPTNGTDPQITPAGWDWA